MDKITYTIDWDKVIAVYNKNHLGQITQKTLADLFEVSGAYITYNKIIPLKRETLERKYKLLYDKHFEQWIPLENVLTKIVKY